MAQAEQTQQEDLVWSEEVENLSEGGNGGYFTPEPGKTEIKFLSNGVVEDKQKPWDKEVKTYVEFEIEVDGEEYKWEMEKGSTPGSKFGQIARYAAAKDGLEGEEITWFRQGEGQQTNHVLMDLEDLDEDDEDEVLFDDEED